MLVSGIICDGPRCKKGLKEGRMEVFWDATAVNKGRAAPPEEYFKFLNRQRTWDDTCTNISDQPPLYNFCSNDCERDFVRDEKPIVTPRERAAIEENNRKVDEKRKLDLETRAARAGMIPVKDWPDKVIDAEPASSQSEPAFARSEVAELPVLQQVEPLPASPTTIPTQQLGTN